MSAKSAQHPRPRLQAAALTASDHPIHNGPVNGKAVDEPLRFIRLREVIRLTTVPRSTIYWLISRGEFPRPVPIGGRVVFVESEIVAWQQARLADRDNKQRGADG